MRPSPVADSFSCQKVSFYSVQSWLRLWSNEEYAAIVIGYNQTKRLVRCADLHAVLKRKGTQLVQNALRWPAASNSTNKAPIPTQLKNLVRKCPQWVEELPPLFKATEIMLNVSRCELCTSSCTKSKPPKPRRAKPETQIVPRVLHSRS